MHLWQIKSSFCKKFDKCVVGPLINSNFNRAKYMKGIEFKSILLTLAYSFICMFIIDLCHHIYACAASSSIIKWF